MQLSILIPIYNFDVRDFVKELWKQCINLNLDFEILLIDDKSKRKYVDLNDELSLIDEINYTKLQENIGRSKIRNLLLESASFHNCLVLDCDLRIDSSLFIKKYIESFKPNIVVVGGHIYDTDPPKNKKELLHWEYGRKIESISSIHRQLDPYHSFKSNSFLISKEIFRLIKFEESLVKYGHEDTMFGIELELNNIELIHIDNPVVHIGLDKAKNFLRKQKHAIENLIIISKNPMLNGYVTRKSKLLSYENSFFLNLYYSLISFYYKNRLYKKLLSDSPKIKTLNFWKFYTLKKMRKKFQTSI